MTTSPSSSTALTSTSVKEDNETPGSLPILKGILDAAAASSSSSWNPNEIVICLQSFLQQRSNDDDDDDDGPRNGDNYGTSNTDVDDDSATMMQQSIVRVVKEFDRIIDSTTTQKLKGHEQRKALEEAARSLLQLDNNNNDVEKNASSNNPTAATILVVLTLAMGSSNDNDQGEEGSTNNHRSIASAICSVVTKQQKQQRHQEGGVAREASWDLIFKLFFQQVATAIRPSNSNDNGISSTIETSVVVDWHIVAGLAKAVGINALQDKELARDVAHVLRDNLGDLLTEEEDDEDNDDALMTNSNNNNKVLVASCLALASQLQPWQSMPPNRLVLLAIQYDLWHAAERICDAAVTGSTNNAPTKEAVMAAAFGEDAVEVLIEGAFQAKLFRQADTYATKFFDQGSRAAQDRYLEARYLHACNTIAKVIRRGALPVVDKQVDRVEKAVAKMKKLEEHKQGKKSADDDNSLSQQPCASSSASEGVEATTTTTTTDADCEDDRDAVFITPANAIDEIRSFTLQQMEETGNIDAAHRMATMWDMDYRYDEAAIAKAAEARRQKYLQWEECLPSGITVPDLVSTPEELTTAMEQLMTIGGDGSSSDNSTTTNTEITNGDSRPLLFGFDVEWSEDDNNNNNNSGGADLLQIASLAKVVLIDIPALSKTAEGVDALTKTVGHIFASKTYTKVGFACRQDLSKLRSSSIGCDKHKNKNKNKRQGGRPQEDNHWFSASNEVVDLKNYLLTSDLTMGRSGLSRVCEKYLGKPLDKSEQCSFWNARPLSLRQRTYAALDAWSVVAVYDQIRRK